MLQTVKDVYVYCVEHQYEYMTYCLHSLLKDKKIHPDDNFTPDVLSEVDEARVVELMKQNYLCFNPTKIYSLKIDKYQWAFVFAASEKEAIEFVQQKMCITPKNCIEYPMDMEMIVGKRMLSFRELREEHFEIPALAGIYEKEGFNS